MPQNNRSICAGFAHVFDELCSLGCDDLGLAAGWSRYILVDVLEAFWEEVLYDTPLAIVTFVMSPLLTCLGSELWKTPGWCGKGLAIASLMSRACRCVHPCFQFWGRAIFTWLGPTCATSLVTCRDAMTRTCRLTSAYVSYDVKPPVKDDQPSRRVVHLTASPHAAEVHPAAAKQKAAAWQGNNVQAHLLKAYRGLRSSGTTEPDQAPRGGAKPNKRTRKALKRAEETAAKAAAAAGQGEADGAPALPPVHVQSDTGASAVNHKQDEHPSGKHDKGVLMT